MQIGLIRYAHLSTPLYRYSSDAVSIMICVNCTLRIYIYAFSDPEMRTDLISIVRAPICAEKTIKLNEQKIDTPLTMLTYQPEQPAAFAQNNEDDNDLFDLEDVEEVQHDDNERASIVTRTLASISRRMTIFDNHPHGTDPESKSP
jgi:hypothetical protein